MLKNRTLFFAALLLSAFGYEFAYFFMTLHIYDLSKSALDIGIFTTLTFIPKLFSSFLGGIADKLGKGRCLAISAFMTAALMLVMTFAASIVYIYAIWFIASIFFTVIMNARGSLMADIMASARYTKGNAWSLSMLNGARILGPLLGGFVTMLADIKILLYFTSLVYVAMGVCALGIKAQSADKKEQKPGVFANVKKGFGFMLQNKTFGLLTTISFFWRLFLGLQLSLFVIYVKSYLNCDSSQYGFFITLMGVGSVAGSMLGPYAVKRIRPFRLIAVGLGFHYISFAMLGICGNYYLSLGIIFISFMIFYMTLVEMHSIRDRITPEGIRGSAYGAVTAVLTPPAITSMLAGSYLTDRFHVTTVLLFTGLLAFASLVVILYLGRKTTLSLQQTNTAGISRDAG